MTSTSTATTEKDAWLAEFNRQEKELARVGRPAVQRLRKSAIARFDELGFPTARTEDWRFTSVAPLLQAAGGWSPGFSRSSPRDRLKAGLQPSLAHVPGTDAACRLVFLNGHYAPELSALPPLPAGVVVGSLAQGLEGHAELVEAHLGRHACFDDNAFTALNTAFFRDGALVVLPRNAVLEQPTYLVFVTAAGSAEVSHVRNLVVAGTAAQATLVEVYAGLGEGAYFTCAVTEVVAEDGAILDHCKLQQEGPGAFHFANTQVHQGRASSFTSHFVGFGGRWVRNEVRALLDAEGCECTLNGLYRASGRQHADNHTVIDHARPHCASHELYKGILDGQAHAVFNGKIFVHQDAQKTDAKQTNQTLLLSDDATINTKPQLEIYADDVKCTHGATVGQLDAEALFYLRSRGIGKDDARSLLTFAFANDILGRIKVEPLRRRLEQTLLEGPALALPACDGDSPQQEDRP
jgi:Fe-S cluster assembly protein SufD